MSIALDTKTGTLTTDRGEAITPSLTRSSFLASSLGSEAVPSVRNEPYASWWVRRELGGRSFHITIYFEGERLRSLDLALTDSAFGTTWSDWSRERELARKAAHDSWLSEVDSTLAPPRRYGWGQVASVFDERAGASVIVLAFDT